MTDPDKIDLAREYLGEDHRAFQPEPSEPAVPKDTLPTDCGVCTYHVHSTKECRHSSPYPGHDEELQVARWNFTKDRGRCGGGSSLKPIVDCGDCVHHYRPDNEPLWPDYRPEGDDWWAGSGLCSHGAPAVTIVEGLWTFWRVTSTAACADMAPGGCGQGISITALLEAAKNKAEADAVKAEKKAKRTPGG